LRRRADPREPGIDDGLREIGVLGKEAITGVHGVRARTGRDVYQFVDAKVRLGARFAAEGVSLVGHTGVHRVPVGVRIYGDAGQARVPAGPNDTDRDLPTVGDEHLTHVDVLPGRRING